MTEEEQIKQELHSFASKRGPSVLVQAKVLAVNEADSTIEVELDNGATIDDVQLRSIVKAGDKVVLIPKVGSIIQMASIGNSNRYYAVAVEEVEKLVIIHQGLEITIDGKLEIKKGADNLKDALTKIIEATQQILVLQGNNPDYAKLIQAQLTINNLLK